MSKTILVAMSGGVDSAVSAYLLKKDGWRVLGVSMKLWETQDGVGDFKGCCSPYDLKDARNAASALDIPFYVVNLEEEFLQSVVRPFINSYLEGKTPNPCVECNRKIKFEILLEKARSLGADYIATGHYARSAYSKTKNRWRLLRGKDSLKDQSYFLYAMTQKQLSRTVFPVGGLTKKKVRALAQKISLPVAEKRESQDICFADGDYAKFIERNADGEKLDAPCTLRDTQGKILGRRNGIWRFTVGQRRGMGISAKEPLYVVSIDGKNGEITVGAKKDLLKKTMRVSKINWISSESPAEPFKAKVKIRSAHKGALAKITPQKNYAIAEFKSPQNAITPGQSAVFYKRNEVLGGGIIEEVLS